MKITWFKRRGIFFIPASIPGWIILAALIGYLIYTFREIDSRSHSASDTLINFAFNMLMLLAAYSMLAYFLSSDSENDEGKL